MTIQHGLTFDAYCDVDATNISSLLQLRKSPLHYKHYLEHGRPDTDAFRIGRASHTATIEPDRFMLDYALWHDTHQSGPKKGKRRIRSGTDWDLFEAQHTDQTILNTTDYLHALRLRDAVRDDEGAAYYLKQRGAAEVTLTWADEETGITCKGRIDWLCDAITDLKFVVDASPWEFGRAAARYSYHVRMSWYVDGYHAVTGQWLPAVMIVVEKSEPHDVVCYRLGRDVLDVGRAAYRKLLGKLVECRATDEWPGIARGDELDLELPAWAMPASEPLVIGGVEVNL